VPVFPLPSLVLFPLVAVPLHIFELRYRTMVRDVLSADRHVAMALLKPGWERDYQGSPEFHPVVCLGTVADIEWLPNDCYNLSVRGLKRARVSRVVREFPYRTALLEPHPEHPYSDDDPLVGIERRAVFAAASRFAGPHADLLKQPEGFGLEAVTNMVCTLAPMPPPEKLALLEEDSVLERARRLREWIARWRPAAEPQSPAAGEGERN